MGEAIAFYTLAAFILGFATLVVTTKDTVHSVLFLVLDFLFVAALYVLLGAQFLKRPPEAHRDPNRRTQLGFWLSAAVLGELCLIAAYGVAAPAPALGDTTAIPVTGNTEQVGWLLSTSYLIPFEVASMLLLVAMIGAIVLAKREL